MTRSVNETLLDAIANQRGALLLRVLTWTDQAAYDAAPTVPEQTWLCDAFDIYSTSAKASIISPTNDYAIASFTVFIIERGVTLAGVEYPIQSGIYFVTKFDETPGRIHIEGSSYPNTKIIIDGDDTYQNVIEAFCAEIGKTAVFKDSADAWLGYQFLPTGKQVILNKAERFENLLKQKYTIQVYERSPEELVFYVPATAQSAWKDITFANSQFVIVAESGNHKVATSSDGAGWTKQTATSYANAIAYSATLDLFVAVGTNTCLTSPDGITWTNRSIPARQWVDIIWSDTFELFIATSIEGKTATSVDGITWSQINSWTARAAAEANGWKSVCWSPELTLFVAVSDSGTNRVMTSPDGITWTARAAAEANEWYSVCWSPELTLFVAVAHNGTNSAMTSPDGITWTARSTSGIGGWNSVCWSPELTLFVAVSDSGTNRVMTSPDGTTWTLRTAAEDNAWYSVCWSPELTLFVAVAYNTPSNCVMTSPNGITWTARTGNSLGRWLSVCWSPTLTLFVAVGYNTLTNNHVMTSPDGITWTARTSHIQDWRSVTWSPEMELFTAVASTGTGTSRVMTSYDGITWILRAAAEANEWFSVCWSPALTLFVAVSHNGTNRVMTSLNPTTTESEAPANGLAQNNSIVVGIGASTAYTTPDGTTWTLRTIPAGTYNAVVYGNSLFVAVGTSSKCATSPDGTTWTARTIPTGTYYGVEWSSALALFVAVGNGVIATSPDGVTWTARTVPAANNWKAVAWSSTLSIFIAISTNGAYRIMTSSNGIDWTVLTALADFSFEYTDGTEFSIKHGLSNVHYLWRDETQATHTEGNTTDPAWNLGYLESTDSPPSEYTDPFYKFFLKKAPIRLDVTDGDRVHFAPNWTLDPTKTIDASIIVAEHFNSEQAPAWWQDINSIAIFEHTEGGALPATIERVAAYTPLVSSGFDGVLTPQINNLQALAQAVDDHDHSGLATTEGIQDIIGAMISGNTETGIAVTYDDTNGKLDFDAQTAGDARYTQTAHDHVGGDGAQIAYSSLSGTPIAEINTNDIFFVSSPGGPSLWTGTISGAPSGTSVTVSAPATGTEAVLVPFSTSQLAKMRLYNLTRGTSALISNYNTGTNVITLTATVPAAWANGDSLTVVSQTVSGAGLNWIDLEITSGPTGKSYLFVKTIIGSATVGDIMRIHPFDASHSGSKYDTLYALVASQNSNGFALIKITGNVFSLSWTGTPTAIVIREAGYLS